MSSEAQAQKNWTPLVSWTYQNGEWREMLEHQKAHYDLQHQISVKRQKITIAAFLVGSLSLWVLIGVLSDDWLSGIAVAVIVAGIGAGLIALNMRGEKKDAKIYSMHLCTKIENSPTPIIEIAKSGIKTGDHLLRWNVECLLTSISMVDKPMKAIRFDYFHAMEPYPKGFVWIPIPQGQEPSARKLLQELNE